MFVQYLPAFGAFSFRGSKLIQRFSNNGLGDVRKQYITLENSQHCFIGPIHWRRRPQPVSEGPSFGNGTSGPPSLHCTGFC